MYTNFMDLQTKKGRLIYVWPVPYEGTVSFATGTKDGPWAILRASYEIETWDQELLIDLQDLAHFETLPFFRPPVSGPNDMCLQMLSYLKDSYNPENDFLLTLGGEHSVTLAPIQFYCQQFPDLVVLQLDAHADLRESFQSSSYSHACVMARVRDLGIPIVQLGLRSLSQEESFLLKQLSEKELFPIFAWDVSTPEETADEIKKYISNRPLYISFDADALDPAILPGTGTPEPGGLSYGWLNRFWPHLLSGLRLVGMDFCELAPLSSCGVVSESVAVKCIQKILMSYLKYSPNV